MSIRLRRPLLRLRIRTTLRPIARWPFGSVTVVVEAGVRLLSSRAKAVWPWVIGTLVLLGTLGYHVRRRDMMIQEHRRMPVPTPGADGAGRRE